MKLYSLIQLFYFSKCTYIIYNLKYFFKFDVFMSVYIFIFYVFYVFMYTYL